MIMFNPKICNLTCLDKAWQTPNNTQIKVSKICLDDPWKAVGQWKTDWYTIKYKKKKRLNILYKNSKLAVGR